jgi:hypothetical protein
MVRAEPAAAARACASRAAAAARLICLTHPLHATVSFAFLPLHLRMHVAMLCSLFIFERYVDRCSQKSCCAPNAPADIAHKAMIRVGITSSYRLRKKMLPNISIMALGERGAIAWRWWRRAWRTAIGLVTWRRGRRGVAGIGGMMVTFLHITFHLRRASALNGRAAEKAELQPDAC